MQAPACHDIFENPLGLHFLPLVMLGQGRVWGEEVPCLQYCKADYSVVVYCRNITHI